MPLLGRPIASATGRAQQESKNLRQRLDTIRGKILAPLVSRIARGKSLMVSDAGGVPRGTAPRRHETEDPVAVRQRAAEQRQKHRWPLRAAKAGAGEKE